MRWLLSLFRLALFIAAVLWLTQQPGTANIVWHDLVIETSAAFLALLILAGAFVLLSVFRLWRFIKDGPRFWRLHQKLRKMERGQHLWLRGMAAIAAGDGSEAGRLAVQTRKLWGHTPATRLLQAQAAQLSGDHAAADEIFLTLATDPESAVLGYRGLIMGALRSNDWAKAEKYVDKLRRFKPETPWLSLIQFEIAAHREDWDEARHSLATATKARLIDAPRANRHQAALFLASLNEPALAGKPDKILQCAERATRLAPDWLPALLALAKAQSDTGHTRTALRLIERTWGLQPHPDLATLYIRINNASEPLQIYKQIERLIKSNPDTLPSQIALAEAALAADLWGAARHALLAIASRADAPQNVFRLLARLERRETGDERATAQWLMKVGDALPDPRWLCDSCGGSHRTWLPSCVHCNAFNTLQWRTPGLSYAPKRTQKLLSET